MKLMKRQQGPFAGCDYCPRKCLYRSDVQRLLTEKNTKWINDELTDGGHESSYARYRAVVNAANNIAQSWLGEEVGGEPNIHTTAIAYCTFLHAIASSNFNEYEQIILGEASKDFFFEDFDLSLFDDPAHGISSARNATSHNEVEVNDDDADDDDADDEDFDLDDLNLDDDDDDDEDFDLGDLNLDDDGMTMMRRTLILMISIWTMMRRTTTKLLLQPELRQTAPGQQRESYQNLKLLHAMRTSLLMMMMRTSLLMMMRTSLLTMMRTSLLMMMMRTMTSSISMQKTRKILPLKMLARALPRLKQIFLYRMMTILTMTMTLTLMISTLMMNRT